MSTPDPSRSYLRARIQIGNAKGPVSFGANQTVFHHDDVNDKTRARREEVRNFARPSVLTKAASWNISTKTDEPLVERRQAENFDHDRSKPYQYNYRAETLGPKLTKQPDKPSRFKVTLKPGSNTTSPNQTTELYPSDMTTLKRTAEMPVHPNLERPFSQDWNVSTEVSKKDLTRAFDDMTGNAKLHTATKTRKYVSKGAYKSPMQRTKEMNEEVRKQKREGTFSVEKPIFQEPEEPVDRKELRNRYAVEPSLNFTTTKHSGVWEFNKAEGR